MVRVNYLSSEAKRFIYDAYAVKTWCICWRNYEGCLSKWKSCCVSEKNFGLAVLVLKTFRTKSDIQNFIKGKRRRGGKRRLFECTVSRCDQHARETALRHPRWSKEDVTENVSVATQTPKVSESTIQRSFKKNPVKLELKLKRVSNLLQISVRRVFLKKMEHVRSGRVVSIDQTPGKRETFKKSIGWGEIGQPPIAGERIIEGHSYSGMAAYKDGGFIAHRV